MDIEQRNQGRYSADLSRNSARFVSPQLACTTFDVAVFKDVAKEPLVKRTDCMHATELEDWVSTDPLKLGTDVTDSRLRIIVGPRANDDPRNGLSTIPLSQPTFELVMEEFRFPKTLLRTIYKGEAMFSGILESREAKNAAWNGLVMRMAYDIAGNKDLAIALSWNLKAGTTYALILGCDDMDLKSIVNFVTYSIYSSGHPLLLLTIFADLQLKRFKVLHRKAYENVQLNIHRARLNRRDGPEVIAVRRTTSAQPPTDYDDATRDVLRNFQDSGFLGQAMLRFRAEVVKVGHAVKSVSKMQGSTKSKRLESVGERVDGQLTQILGRYDIFIERNRLTTNEASLLMSAFWNLIAQRDNKTNQAIATESKNIAEQSKNLADESMKIAENSIRIAKQTKQDSSAVKAISLLTMVFLPATYSATVLALPMFNWRPGPHENVLDFHYFRIYLALAIPLTVVVLFVWSVWTWWSDHQLNEDGTKRPFWNGKTRKG